MQLVDRTVPFSARWKHFSIGKGLVLIAFIGFQLADSITTHHALALGHAELNPFMVTVLQVSGELAAYAVKGSFVAILLAILMVLQHRKPWIWDAYCMAAGLSGMALILNLHHLT